MKDSSVIQTIISSPNLLAQVQTWVDDLPSVTLVTADHGLTLDQVDLMILDWSAYSTSGVVAELKHSSCPWLVVSDEPSIEQELQVLAEGGADYLRGPFDPAVSRLRLNIQLSRKQAHDRLKSLSVTDTLTGLYNRRKFDEELLQCWKQGGRQGTPCSLLMIDIDYFKRYNDHYGHLEGDQCLASVARVLAECAVRPRDIVARIGGEEFALLLPDTPETGAKIVAARLLESLDKLGIVHQASPLGYVSISVGVATVLPKRANVRDWQQAADQALYQAKHAGRNQMASLGMTAKAEEQVG